MDLRQNYETSKQRKKSQTGTVEVLPNVDLFADSVKNKRKKWAMQHRREAFFLMKDAYFRCLPGCYLLRTRYLCIWYQV